MGAAARSPGRTAADAPRVFRTGDLDHARAETARLYYPLRIETLGAPGSFGLDMTTVTLGPLTLGRLTYGTDISKDCGDLRTAYHVNVPLRGRVASTCGDQHVLATPRVAAVFNPSGRTVLDRWAAGSTQLCLKIGRDMLETELTERLDRPMREPLRFRLAMDATAPGSQSWLCAVQMLASELDNPAVDMTTSPLAHFTGYHGDKDATAAGRFTPDGRWWLTGDAGYMDARAVPVSACGTRPRWRGGERLGSVL